MSSRIPPQFEVGGSDITLAALLMNSLPRPSVSLAPPLLCFLWWNKETFSKVLNFQKMFPQAEA